MTTQHSEVVQLMFNVTSLINGGAGFHSGNPAHLHTSLLYISVIDLNVGRREACKELRKKEQQVQNPCKTSVY